MEKINDLTNNQQEIDCIGCALAQGKANRTIPLIAETKNFLVDQDFTTPIPGFMIISSKKHIKGIEELDEEQRKEFIELIYKVRRAMTKTLSIEYVYMIQKENTIAYSSHFHVWLFPRYRWMDNFGNKISSITEIIEHARDNMKTEEVLADVKNATNKIRDKMSW